MKYYSPSLRGFFDPEFHGKNIPSDSVEITDDKWRELLDGNSKGMDIVPDEHGFPQSRPHVMTDAQRKASLPFQKSVALRRANDVIERHRDEVALGQMTTISDADYKSLIAYRTEVRAATEELPEIPECIKAELKGYKHV